MADWCFSVESLRWGGYGPPSTPALGEAGGVDTSHLHSCDVRMPALLQSSAVYGQHRGTVPAGQERKASLRKWPNGSLGSQTFSTAAHTLPDFDWQTGPYRSHGLLGAWLTWLPSTLEGWVQVPVLYNRGVMVLISTGEVKAEGSGIPEFGFIFPYMRSSRPA